MKLSHTAVLTAIFVKYVNASASIVGIFRGAVDRGEVITAVDLYNFEWKLRSQEEGLDYAILKDDPDFLSKFIVGIKAQVWYTIVKLYENASKATRDEVLETVTFPQSHLICAASTCELICSPKNFVNLLNRIETPEGQEKAIKQSVEQLFDNKRTDCIDPMLAVLEDNKFLSEDLTTVAIRRIFHIGVAHHNEFWVKQFYDHPLITPAIYASALIESHQYVAETPVFSWLLAAADQGDLLAVRDEWNAFWAKNDFCSAIEKAILAAKPGGFRLSIPIRRVKIAKEIFKELGHDGIPQTIGDLIGSYML